MWNIEIRKCKEIFFNDYKYLCINLAFNINYFVFLLSNGVIALFN